MDLGLRGKVAVVTGGSKGIGYAAAKVFLEEGAKVAICARHEEELRQAAGELEQLGPVYWEAVDVTDAQANYVLQNMYTGILAVLMSGSIMWGPPAFKKVRNMMTGK